MSTVVAYESTFELLKFRFFLYYHMRKYLASNKSFSWYAGDDMSDLYSIMSCGTTNLYNEYIYTRLYFNYNKVGFFSKSLKFDKYLNLVGNECELIRKDADIFTGRKSVSNKIFGKYMKSRGSSVNKKKLEKKCSKYIETIYKQDKMIIADWIKDIQDKKSIHTTYSSNQILGALKSIADKLERVRINDIIIPRNFGKCDDIRGFSPLMHYRRVVEVMFQEFNIDEEESQIVKDTNKSFLSLLQSFSITNKKSDEDDLTYLKSMKGSIDDASLDREFLKLIKKIHQASAKSNAIGSKTLTLNNKYRYLLEKKQAYVEQNEMLQSNIEELVDRLNKARRDLQSIKNIKVDKISSANFLASEALNKKLKDIKNMEQSQASIKELQMKNLNNIKKIENKIEEMDREIKETTDPSDFLEYLKRINPKAIEKGTKMEYTDDKGKTKEVTIPNMKEAAKKDAVTEAVYNKAEKEFKKEEEDRAKGKVLTKREKDKINRDFRKQDDDLEKALDAADAAASAGDDQPTDAEKSRFLQAAAEAVSGDNSGFDAVINADYDNDFDKAEAILDFNSAMPGKPDGRASSEGYKYIKVTQNIGSIVNWLEKRKDVKFTNNMITTFKKHINSLKNKLDTGFGEDDFDQDRPAVISSLADYGADDAAADAADEPANVTDFSSLLNSAMNDPLMGSTVRATPGGFTASLSGFDNIFGSDPSGTDDTGFVG